MRLIDIVTGPWAITPEMLVEIQNIYCAHVRGPKIDIKSIESRIGRPLKNEQRPYSVTPSGIAILPAVGVVGKRMNLLTRVSGGVSTELLGKQILEAMDDRAVSGLLLEIDSPGGTVDGTQELARLIYDNRGRKPIWAFSDGMIASAAYWIASAADRIYISGDTNRVGSIGVVARHIDISKAEEMRGVKTTEITAGRYKRIDSMYAPLSEEGRATIQDEVDYIYSVFVHDVAMFRGVSVDTVLDERADGRLFLGQQAVEAGLVDGAMSREAVLDAMARTIAEGRGKEMSPKVEVAAAQQPTAGPNLSHDSKLAPSEPSWGSVDKTKLPRAAFAEQGDPDKKSTWGFPHHWVKNGKLGPDGVYTSGTMYLHRGGLAAAWQAARGARSGKQASPAVKAHLQSHRRAIGMGDDDSSASLVQSGVSARQATSGENQHEKEGVSMDLSEVTAEMLVQDRPDLVKEVLATADDELVLSDKRVREAISQAVAKAEKGKDATIGALLRDATTGILSKAKQEALEQLTVEDLQKHPKFKEAVHDYVGRASDEELEEFPQVVAAAKRASAVSTEFLNNVVKSMGVVVPGDTLTLSRGRSTFRGLFRKEE